MDDPFFVDYLNSLDHLNCDVETGFQIELPPALLEKVLQTLSKQVHDHNVKHLSIFSFLITHEVQIWNRGLSSQFMYQFGLPEKHNVLLVLDCLLDLSCEDISVLFLFDLV